MTNNERTPLRITPGYTLREIIEHAILAAVRRNHNSFVNAAKELGVSVKTIYNRTQGQR